MLTERKLLSPTNSLTTSNISSCDGQSFVIKRVSESFFQLSRELREEFADSRRLRMHVDYNEEQHTLVYKYFTSTFLALLGKHPNFPLAGIKKILRYTGEAIRELHAKDWIHIGKIQISGISR